jgi:alpha-1,3-rhamnosyltransferase
MNEGLDWCRGEFFSPIASDDVMLVEKVRVQVEFMIKNPHVDCLFSNVRIINEHSNVISCKKKNSGFVSFEDLFLYKKSILAPTLLAKTAALRSVGGYPSNLYIDDWYMWLTLTFFDYQLYQTPDVLVSYRKHTSNASSDLKKMHEARRQIILRYFSKHKLCDLALACTDVQYAVEILNFDRVKSLKLFFSALVAKPNILLQIKIYHYLVRFFAPYVWYQALKFS